MKISLVLPFFVAVSMLPVAAAAQDPGPVDFEEMFALASNCSVSLSKLQDMGVKVNSSPDDWINVLLNLEDRIDRDAFLEYQFREAEISALLEVEPEETTAMMVETAAQCAGILPAKGSSNAVRKANASTSDSTGS